MSDTKITRILLNLATCEDGISKGHEAKAKLLRELAAEIEFPEKEHSPTKNPNINPNSDGHIEVKIDSWEDAEKLLGEAAAKWLKRLADSTVRPTSWPF